MTLSPLVVCGVLTLFSRLSTDTIPLNQVGYYPNAKKVVVVKDTSKADYSIVDAVSRNEVFTGTLSAPAKYQASNEYVKLADFTQLNTPGTYSIVVGKTDTSQVFTISSELYKDALPLMMKSYYYQRASMKLDSLYAGKWFREAGHPDMGLEVIDVDPPINNRYDVPGGWYDAGDYGKYVVCAGITCGTLMGIYELLPQTLGDGTLNIPESKNGKPDILDEIKYELDWMLTMQDTDGGVFFKVGPTSWPDMIMPSEDPTDRYIIGKSTTSSLDFASVMAMASRVYSEYDGAFADKCLTSARKAWEWSLANPRVGNPTNTEGTGPYADGSDLTYSDETIWAASELFITTGEKNYHDTLLTMLKRTQMSNYAWWQDVRNQAFYSLAANRLKINDNTIDSIVKFQILKAADNFCQLTSNSAYRIAMNRDDYLWGSAGTAGNMAIIPAYAHYLTQDRKYLDCLVMHADFLFGKNPTGYSFVTGVGIRSPRAIHHRPSCGDGINDPIPGFVVGGPNGSPDGADDRLVEIIENNTPPAKCYIDFIGSYASNEVAINQNAPWIFVLAYLQKFADNGTPSKIISRKQINIAEGKPLSIHLPNNRTICLSRYGHSDSWLILLDGRGRIIEKTRLNKLSQSIKLNLPDLAPGVYFLSLSDGNSIHFIVNKT